MNKVSAGDVDLHLLDEGEGDVLLFVHGFPLSHAMWGEQVAAFRGTHCVLAPDLRGFGANEPASGVVTMEQYADDLVAILDALRIQEPITLCGLSMGGYIAWRFWERHASRLRRLILCDTRARADDSAMQDQRAKTAARAISNGMDSLSRMMAANLFAKETAQRSPEIVDATRQVIANSAPESVAAALHGMAARTDMTPSLSKIQTPVLALCGEHDEITPAAEMESMAGDLPNAEYQTIKNAGHMAPLENPSDVNAAIQDWLART